MDKVFIYCGALACASDPGLDGHGPEVESHLNGSPAVLLGPEFYKRSRPHSSRYLAKAVHTDMAGSTQRGQQRFAVAPGSPVVDMRPRRRAAAYNAAALVAAKNSFPLAAEAPVRTGRGTVAEAAQPSDRGNRATRAEETTRLHNRIRSRSDAYRRKVLSVVTSVRSSAIAWAMSLRSNGSLWTGGKS